ncbi:MAG: hypothetical protein CMJ78_14585 [Planctomycetaceae bacterium]|nr:hypothetical protein [Planctomycetaceae bacterium]
MNHTATPTRIAFCITELDPGGAEQTLVQLVKGLDRDQWEPRVYCLGPDAALAEPIREAGIPVTCFGARGILDAFVVFRLASELEKFQPAVLQTFLFHANVLGRLAARLARIPIVVSGIRVAEQRSRWPLRIDRWTNSLVNQNVAVSESVKRFSIETAGLDEGKLIVIPNGVDASRFETASPANLEELAIPSDAKKLLFVGRLEFQKAPELLLEAVTPLMQQDESIHLLLAGEGPMKRELTEQANAASLANRIHFLGRREDVPGLMKASTLLVSPARWEGMPNVLLEAMSAALPIVATDVEGVSELIQDGVSGWLSVPNSADELRTAIRKALESPNEWETLSLAAQTIAKNGLTYHAMTQRYAAVYRNLLQ